MSQFLPKDGFQWYTGDMSVAHITNMLNNMDDTSDVGMVLEVDVFYPEKLHDQHNDLPYLPEKMVPPGSKLPKLTANLQHKKNYVVHYTTLKQSMEAGLQLDKIHKIITFNQSPWLKSYISLNTEKRKLAVTDFQKDFYKLMNNSVFGEKKKMY